MLLPRRAGPLLSSLLFFLLFLSCIRLPSARAQTPTVCIVAGNLVFAGDVITTNCSHSFNVSLCTLYTGQQDNLLAIADLQVDVVTLDTTLVELQITVGVDVANLQGQIDNILPYLGNGTVIDNPCHQSVCGLYTQILSLNATIQAIIAENGTFVTLGTAQTITGNKNFSGLVVIQETLTFTAVSDQLAFQPGATGNTLFITANQPSGASRTVTFVDPGSVGSVNVVMTNSLAGQVIADGTLSFTGTPTFDASGPQQFVMVDSTSGNALGFSIGVMATAPQHITFVDPGSTTANVMMTQTLAPQIVGALTTFTNTLTLTAASDQLSIQPGGTGNNFFITAATPGQITTLTIPNPGQTTATFILSAGAQTFTGITTFSSATTSVSSTTGGVVVTGGIGIGANGAVDATSATDGGGITDAGGLAVAMSAWIGTTLNLVQSNNQIRFVATGHILTISATTITAAAQTYTIQDAGGNAFFVLSAGTQSLAGTYTFTHGVAITATIDQLVLGSGPTTTINAAAPGSSTVVSFPTLSGGANFMLTNAGATQTFTTVIGFTQITSFSSATTSVSSVTGGAVFTGGIGVGANGGVDATSITDGGGITDAGGLAVALSAWIGTTLNLVQTTGQILFGAPSHIITLSVVAPTTSHTYTVNDAGTNAFFVLSAGTQSLAGTYTFSNAIVANAGVTFPTGTNPTETIFDVNNNGFTGVTFSCGGAASTPSMTIPIRKWGGASGGTVCIQIPAFTATCVSGNQAVSSASLPSGGTNYNPAVTAFCLAAVVNSGSVVMAPGAIAVTTSGGIILYENVGEGAFGTGTGGLQLQVNCCWATAT